MQRTSDKQAKSGIVKNSKELVVYQSKPQTICQEKPLSIKQMIQLQLYLHIHPIMKENDCCRMEYMSLLEFILQDYIRRNKWKNSLIKLYREKLLLDFKKYRTIKKNVKLPKHYNYKDILLTDCLFIGAYDNKDDGIRIIKDIEKIQGGSDEYILKAFYSKKAVLNFNKRFPNLFEIYRVIWHNRQFLKKPIKKVMITANMSAGKSTLLNALVGKKVNKMQNEVCTAKRHFLYNKAGEDGFNYELDYDLELDATEDILMTDNEKNSSEEICVGTRFFTIFNLDERVCFIDTPGANSSLNKEHRKIAENVITSEKCDLLIYLLNAENIGTDADYKHLRFVKENYSGSIIFLVNKLDHFQKGVDSVRETLAKVRKDIKSLGFKDADVYPISAYAAYLAKRKLLGYELNKEELYELGYLTLKLNSSDFNYDKYYHLQKNKKVLLKTASADLQQLLIHSGIVSLENIIYRE